VETLISSTHRSQVAPDQRAVGSQTRRPSHPKIPLSIGGFARSGSSHPLADLARSLADDGLVHPVLGHKEPDAWVCEEFVKRRLAVPAHIGLADGAQRYQSDNETIVGVDPAALLAPRGLRSHMHQRTSATR
jgi:hypothetical protein